MKAAIWQSIEMLARFVADMSSLHNQRLRRIEDRLAALDGGNDAEAALRSALAAANDGRITAGHEPLSLTIRDGGVKFVDRESRR